MIRHTSSKPRAQALDEALRRLDPPPALAPDLCLVLGGDGAMLEAIQRHPGRRYFGVNCGHVGFLMNDLPGDADAVARRVLEVVETGAYFTQPFPRLRMRADTPAGERNALALNDVYIERQSGTSCHLEVRVDGLVVVEHMVCDGVIAATPLGSTAYAFSAGGAAAHPLVRALQLTAICPHTPRLAPVLLAHDAVVHVHVIDPPFRPARAVADGITFADVTEVEVRMAEGEDVPLCFVDGHDFTGTLIRKILHP